MLLNHKAPRAHKKGYYFAVFFPFQCFLNRDGLIHVEDLCVNFSPSRKHPQELRLSFSSHCRVEAAGVPRNLALFPPFDPDVVLLLVFFSFFLRCWPDPTPTATHRVPETLRAPAVTSHLGLSSARFGLDLGLRRSDAKRITSHNRAAAYKVTTKFCQSYSRRSDQVDRVKWAVVGGDPCPPYLCSA